MVNRTDRPPRPLDKLSTRVTAVAVTVAFLAVLIAGIVSYGLVGGAAIDQARATLARQADLVAATVDRTGVLRRPAVTALLGRDQVAVAMLGPGRAVPGYLTSFDVTALESGAELSDVRTRSNGVQLLVEGRPLAGGTAVVLAQPVSVTAATSASGRRRLFWPLLAGLVGAAAVGWLLSRRLARPVQRAADAAHRLAGGARDVRLEPDGPYELAELATALNRLTSALATSEGRERDFLLSVSHELRTPLTAVTGYAEALADSVVPPDQVAATGAVLVAESARLDRLVGDLLDLARLRAQDFRLELASVDLTALAGQAGQVWRDRCTREGVRFGLELPEAALMVRTDPTRVRQILDGLAENALRVTPAGEPVIIAVSADPTDPAWAWLQVRDGGPGLTDEDLAVAFDRSALYERYRGVRRVGTGLGLALVHGLATRLGGSALAGRAPEGGACFSVRLPLGGPAQPGPATRLP